MAQGIRLEWYEPKRQRTLDERGLDFADLAHSDWGAAIDIEDARIYDGEKRRVSIGYLNSRLIVVAYTVRDGCIRIISMRKANEREVRRHGKARGNQ